MKKQCFDRFVHLISDACSRRSFLGLAVASGFVAAGWEPAKGRKKSCRNIRCTECAPCHRGKCRPKPDGTPCSYMNGTCQGGSCQPPA